MNLSFRKILAPLTIATLLIGLSLPVQATVPTPPGQIILPDPGVLEALEPINGSFRLETEVRLNLEVHNPSIVLRIERVDPIDPEEVHVEEYVLGKQDDEGTSKREIQIEVQGRDGLYRIDVELLGGIRKAGGVIDRRVLFQLVEAGKSRILTPPGLRRRSVYACKEAFRRSLEKKPNAPNVRLLAESAVRVPDSITDGVRSGSEEGQLGVRGVGPADEIKPYVVDRRDQAWQKQDPITVRGRLVYLDFEDTWRPLVNVSVNLYDDEELIFPSEHLGTTATNGNGDWSFNVDNDDGWGEGGRDVYYKFHLVNDRFGVLDANENNYIWKSNVVKDVGEGDVVSFGSETGSTNPEAMQVFGFLNRGWEHIVRVGRQDPGYIETRFPSFRTRWSHDFEILQVQMEFADGPDVVLHEYGHALMYYAFGKYAPGPHGQDHDPGNESQDKGLALSEGWATAFALSVCPDGRWGYHEGRTEASGEWPNCTMPDEDHEENNYYVERFTTSRNRVGEENEGRVAAAINDFLDVADDDNGGNENRGRNGVGDANAEHRVRLSTIYRDNMWGYRHEDFLELWTAVSEDLTDTQQDYAADIMWYNWMSQPIQLKIQCVASKIVAAGRKDRKELLRGLRFFRDRALKPLDAGRFWIQTYYRHSPELAMILLKDSGARGAAVIVAKHFSQIGNTFAGEGDKAAGQLEKELFVPPHVSDAACTLLDVIEESGSREMRLEVVELRSTLASMMNMSVHDAMIQATRMMKRQNGRGLRIVDPHDRAPGSREVDWGAIQKYISEK